MRRAIRRLKGLMRLTKDFLMMRKQRKRPCECSYHKSKIKNPETEEEKY